MPADALSQDWLLSVLCVCGSTYAVLFCTMYNALTLHCSPVCGPIQLKEKRGGVTCPLAPT